MTNINTSLTPLNLNILGSKDLDFLSSFNIQEGMSGITKTIQLQLLQSIIITVAICTKFQTQKEFGTYRMDQVQNTEVLMCERCINKNPRTTWKNFQVLD